MSQPSPCRLSIIAPCRNEKGNIDPLVRRTTAFLDDFGRVGELILVDDGSTDRTWAAICHLTQKDHRVRGVRHESNRGIVPAWRTGLHAARGDLVCLMDADLQNRPEDIQRLYDAYELGGADVVQGVRKPVCSLHRHRIFTRGLNTTLNLVFGTRLKDNKSGFLLCPREVLELILRQRFSYRYFQALVGAAAVARGLTIREVDTIFEPRHSGQSFLSRFPVRPALRILWELLKFRTETWLESSRQALPRGSVAGCA